MSYTSYECCNTNIMEHFTAVLRTLKVQVIRLSSIVRKITVKSSGKFYFNFP